MGKSLAMPLIAIGGSYFLYWRTFIVQRAKLHVGNNTAIRRILSRQGDCPKYVPPFLWSWWPLQLAASVFRNNPPLSSQQAVIYPEVDVLEMNDGGEVGLLWPQPLSEGTIDENHPCYASSTPSPLTWQNKKAWKSCVQRP